MSAYNFKPSNAIKDENYGDENNKSMEIRSFNTKASLTMEKTGKIQNQGSASRNEEDTFNEA